MNIDFEIFGQITDAETFARGPSIRELSQLRARFGTDAGESAKGLPMCVSVMLRYGLPKFIGTKPMVLVK